MKTFVLLLATLTTALANPVLTSSGVLSRHKCAQCPTNGTLPADVLSPSLMKPISSSQPNRSFERTHVARVTARDFCTIFNFEIPATAVNKTCTLKFLFPNHQQTSNWYTTYGPGDFVFKGYAYGTGATPETTYNTQPAPGPGPPPGKLLPGNAYVLNSGSCGIQPGQQTSSTVSGALCSNDDSTALGFHQMNHHRYACPLGFYVIIS